MEQGEVDRIEAPLKTKDVWSIRTKLQVEKRARGLAMFNLAIDSKLRGCDMVRLKMWRQMVSRSIVLPSGREKPDIPTDVKTRKTQ